MGAVTLGPISAAWAAAPSNDALVPTPNDTISSCAQGYAARGTTVCQTDNSTVTYYMDSNGEFELEQVDRDIVVSAMAKYRNNTVLSISYDSTPTFSGSGETDVIYQEGDFGFPDDYIGIVWCNDVQNGSTWKCDQQYVRIRGAGKITNKSARHETGHAFGLMHGPQWAPSRGHCDDIVGIMRGALDCMDDANLGSVVKNNIDWVYG